MKTENEKAQRAESWADNQIKSCLSALEVCNAKLQSRISELEAQNKKYEEALREIVSECRNEKSDLLNSIHKIEEIATEALNHKE